MILDIPYTKVFINNRYIKEEPEGSTEAYLFSVTCLLNRPLLFTAHTRDGAIYSRLPLWALTTTKCMSFGDALVLGGPTLEPWSVLGEKAQVIKHAYLKDYKLEVISHKIMGRYLFTIDYLDGGFSEDPEQHKNSNIIALDNGQIGAYPNNMILAKDKHFTHDGPLPAYKRNTFYYSSDG